MPGLDSSDYIAFLRVLDHPASIIAAEIGKIVARIEGKIDRNRELIAEAAEEHREIVLATCGASIRRCENMLIRLRSADPWACWPVKLDQQLHGSAAWARQGYWQGYFPDPSSRFPLVKRQWQGDGIASSIAAFGFATLRERLAVWAMAHWWIQVSRDWLEGRLPGHLLEAEAICAEDWWNANLSGIAWGSGVGKPPGEQERRLYDLRAQGYGWKRACREVYSDEATAAMIARHLEGWEASDKPMGYGHDKRSWPRVTLN